MLTLAEAKEYLGKRGAIALGGLKIYVNIVDYKHVYGNDRFLVKPLSGEGEIWVKTPKTLPENHYIELNGEIYTFVRMIKLP